MARVQLALMFLITMASFSSGMPWYCWFDAMEPQCAPEFIAAITLLDPTHVGSQCCHTLSHRLGSSKVCLPSIEHPSSAPSPSPSTDYTSMLRLTIRHCRTAEHPTPPSSSSASSSLSRTKAPQSAAAAAWKKCLGKLSTRRKCLSEMAQLEMGVVEKIEPRCCPDFASPKCLEWMELLLESLKGLRLVEFCGGLEVGRGAAEAPVAEPSPTPVSGSG